MEAHSESQIRSRFSLIGHNTRGNNNKTIARIAREYGVNPAAYYPGMSDEQIITTTLNNQSTPSQLEAEMIQESQQYSF